MGDKPDLLLIKPVPPGAMNALPERYTIHRYWEAADKPAFLDSVAGRIRAAATTAGGAIGRAEMARLPNLALVANWGVGYDSVDAAAAAERGIVVTNTPDVLTETVADTTFMLILATVRRAVFQDRYVREGRWLREGPPPLTDDVWGQPIGIVGLGRIGMAVARRAEGFGMPISYHNRNRRPDVPYTYFGSAADLARHVRILVVITPGGPANVKMIDRTVIDALGPRGYLVNVSRGPNVDEAYLLEALRENRIAGAGLDVFAAEPKVPEGFFALDNVVLSPHQGSATHQTRNKMGDLVVANLVAHFAGEPLPSAVV